MAAPVQFYFDFYSPYGYLASEQIDALCAKHGRETDWRPIMLGVVFKQTGQQPLIEVPLKGDYSKRDMLRTARLWGGPFVIPDAFPFPSISACRAAYWAKQKHPEKAKPLMQALLRRAWNRNQDIAKPESVVEVAGEVGLDREEVAKALQDPAVKDGLRQALDASMAAGVFGSPYIVVDGEPFWGNDRLAMVDEWLKRGGW
ncbi:MAG TPA: 2-hydroxychromene-2-carboxylate isomerase [Kiloniellales bacterium]|nr:2-hydroxychromene-2-carboxylate isomerase [Kiloniellales bacterium]